MPVKSIIDVEVNDGAFKRFAQLFQRYQQGVGQTGALWRAANLATGSAAKAVGVASAAAASMSAALTRASAAMRTIVAMAQAAGSAWRVITGYSSTFSQNITKATASMLRWTGLVGALGGLLGIGGLFGLEHIASRVTRERRSAAGLGTTPGGLGAFESLYGRFVGPDFLANINEALSDASKSWAFNFANIPPDVMKRRDSAEIATYLLPAIQRFVKTTPPGSLVQNFPTGPGQFVGLSQAQAIAGAQPGELADLAKRFLKERPDVEINPAQQRVFSEFNSTIELAERKIHSAFVEGLEPAIPALKDLSGVLADLVRDFARKVDKDAVRAFGETIQHWAKEMGSPEFRQRISQLASDFSELSRSVGTLVRRIKAFFSMTPRDFMSKGGEMLGEALYAPAPGSIVDQAMRAQAARAAPHIGGRGYHRGFNPRHRSFGFGGQTVGENDPNRKVLGVDTFSDRFSASNFTDHDVEMTIKTRAGASTPKAGVMIGAGAQ